MAHLPKVKSQGNQCQNRFRCGPSDSKAQLHSTKACYWPPADFLTKTSPCTCALHLIKTLGLRLASSLPPEQPEPHLALRPQLTSEGRPKGEEHTQEDVPRHGSILVNNLALGDGEDDSKHLEKHGEG